MKPPWMALAAAVALAGCGTGATPREPNATQIAAKIGCVNPTADPEPELFMADEVDCTLGGAQISIGTFASSGAAGNWKKAADSFGATGTVVIGALYVVEANTGAQARNIASMLGATVD